MTGIRPFYVCVTLFAAGILGAQISPFLVPVWPALLAATILVPCFASARTRPVALFAAGMLWAMLCADLRLSDTWPAPLEGRDATVTGTVASLPEPGRRYLKFDLDVERAAFAGGAVDFSGRIRLRWYEISPALARRLKAGSRWRLRVRLKQPHGYYNPGGFDYEAYLFGESVRATGYVRRSAANLWLSAAPGTSPPAWRQALRERLDRALVAARFPGLIKALAIGDRAAISDDRWETLRRTGTTHLMAISGLHVGFAAGLGMLLGMLAGRAATLVWPTLAAPQVAALSGLGVALLYAGISGFEVPAQRAFVMVAVLLLGVLWRRHVWNLRGLCLALLVVLAINPASLHGPGLWLSFSAVALIFVWLARADRHRRRRVIQALALQGLLSLALLPLAIGFFGLGSLLSAPANLLAVPVVMFAIVPLCLLGTVLLGAGLGPAAAGVLALADRLLGLLWTVLAWLGGLPWAAVSLPLAAWQGVVLFAGILVLLGARTRRRYAGLGAALVLLAPAPGGPAPGAFRVTVLDVGQGLSAVVETARRTLVYDLGARYPGGFSLAEAVLVPYLHWRGVERLDTLVISHGDNDHRGGFEDLAANYPPVRILSSVAGELGRGEYCRRGQRWRWDGVDFEILHPRQARPPPHNNASCVLRIRGAHGSVLLTGDIEAEAERSLLEDRAAALDSDVLLVPHHGSRNSSTPRFIDRVAPRLATVSAGYVNRYGHPDPEVLARYRRRGIAVVNTATAGAILISVSARGITFEGWRRLRPRYWLD